MVENLGLILAKLQDTFGTPETSLSEVTNYFPALRGNKIEQVPVFNPVEEMAGTFDQDLGSIGMVGATAELSCYMRSLGANIPPDFALLARACGMSETITYYQITLTVGADKTATWSAGNAIQNDTGDGNHWTGTITTITATTIVVALVTGTYADITVSEGVENTTISDTVSASAKTSSNKYEYVPAADFTTKDLTAWQYGGGVGSGKSILTKVGNIVGNWKISIEAGKIGTFQLTNGAGKFISETADTLVTPTKSRVVYPAALGWTIDVCGVAYNVTKMDFDGGHAVDQRINGTEAYGFGDTKIGDKKGKFSLQFYADASLALPSVAVLASAVEAAFSLYYGPTGRKLRVDIAYPQFQNWKRSAVGNLTVFDVDGIMTRNDFKLTANSDLT